jgi:hypothetical protein
MKWSSFNSVPDISLEEDEQLERVSPRVCSLHSRCKVPTASVQIHITSRMRPHGLPKARAQTAV